MSSKYLALIRGDDEKICLRESFVFLKATNHDAALLECRELWEDEGGRYDENGGMARGIKLVKFSDVEEIPVAVWIDEAVAAHAERKRQRKIEQLERELAALQGTISQSHRGPG